jgi:hypothetical protein
MRPHGNTAPKNLPHCPAVLITDFIALLCVRISG